MRLHMMSTKIAQNIHKICFQVIWMTFIGDLIINLIILNLLMSSYFL